MHDEHQLDYRRTQRGAFRYEVWDTAAAHRGASVRVAAGDVTGLTGNPDAIRAHLTRIGREAIGRRSEPVLGPGHHAGTPAASTRTSTRTSSRRKADRP